MRKRSVVVVAGAWFLLLTVLHVSLCWMNGDEILVSLAVDAENEEILNEGIRAFRSLMMFGERLKNAHIDICIIEESHTHTEQVSQSLNSIYERYASDSKNNKLHIRHVQGSSYFPRSDYFPTINKLFSFEGSLFYVNQYPEIKYFLYIDADIFLLKDPIEAIEREFFSSNFLPKADILCSLPWNSFSELNLFPDFVQFLPSEPKEETRTHYSFLDDLFNVIRSPELTNVTKQGLSLNNPDYPFMKTINPGGRTFHGLCNTGFFFMPIEMAQQLYITSLRYLSIINNFSSSITVDSEEAVQLHSFYSTQNVMIDSLVLWASMMYLKYQTIIASVELNYIIPAGNLLLPHTKPTLTLDGRHWIPSEPYLLHFSRGSDFTFSNCACDSQFEHNTIIKEDGNPVERNQNLCQATLVANEAEFVYSNHMIISNGTFPTTYLPLFVFEHYIIPKIISVCDIAIPQY